uniref:Ribosomal protein L6 n=1 Tax=Malawimonas jakobiformis TaxID=136089 RepID=Q9G865_MALJA|nr:ribosomal protein L6 [Malawimonas jakobiformis]AAG13712.1 ribosomal protein L6 [Malawimonas jakobiformis]
MSNIGKNPIMIPNNVKIEIINKYLIVIGNLGVLIKKMPDTIELLKSNNRLFIKTKNFSLWGTYRMLINNMVIGVSKGFIIKLRLVGVGYRFFIENKHIKLKIGYTNMIKISIPNYIKVKSIKNTILYLYGLDLQKIKEYAYKIRLFKQPDPYKGKGILFENEIIHFKEGKKK